MVGIILYSKHGCDMKKLFFIFGVILPSLVLVFISLSESTFFESTEDQSVRANQELWKIEKQFQLEQWVATVEVKRIWDLSRDCPDVWGCTEIQPEKPPQILLLDTRDYPQSMPQAKRIPWQNHILQHEVMHIKLTELGVPAGAQDGLIYELQPSMIKP